MKVRENEALQFHRVSNRRRGDVSVELLKYCFIYETRTVRRSVRLLCGTRRQLNRGVNINKKSELQGSIITHLLE